MHFKSIVATLAAATHLAVAAPGSTKEVEGSLMRLIKTSEEDPGQWMTQAEVDNLAKQSRRTKFIDITDIKVPLPFPQSLFHSVLIVTRMTMFSRFSPRHPQSGLSKPARSLIPQL